MGLISKIGRISGAIKSRVSSAVGAVRRTASPTVQRLAGNGVVRGAARVASVGFKVAKFAAKRATPAIAIATTALAGAKLIRTIRDKRKAKTAGMTMAGSAAGAASSAISGGAALASASKSGGSILAKLKGLASNPAARTAAIAAGVAGAGFVGEQIAERLGVRGGAGFIGRRKKKRATTRKRTRRSRRRTRRRTSRRGRRGGRVSFTTRDGRRVSFTPRRHRSSRGRISSREASQIERYIRRKRLS